jgi:hypothetical protein
MRKMNIKEINEWTIVSILLLLAGILFYIYWGVTYNVWADIGIYSITIFLVLSGFCGFLLSYLREKEDTD